MSLGLIFLLAAAASFVFEALSVSLGRFPTPKWWALGVAFYLLSLAAG